MYKELVTNCPGCGVVFSLHRTIHNATWRKARKDWNVSLKLYRFYWSPKEVTGKSPVSFGCGLWLRGFVCNPLLSSSLSNCVLPFSFNRRGSGSSLKCCNMLLPAHSTSHLNKNHLKSFTLPAEIWAASTLFLRQLSWQPVKNCKYLH